MRVCAAVIAVLVTTGAAVAQPLDRLTIIAPAAPGGGWDQTARAMQRALEASGAAESVEVENIAGAAGTIGLAHLISRHRGNGRVLMITGLVMLGAILVNRPAVSLADATPIARLTGEYEVIVAPAASPVQSMPDLVAALRARPERVSWGGGSAGGTDHLLAGLIASAVGISPRRVNYVAFSGGGEAAAALVGNQVSVGVSGYGEFAPHIASGRLRVLAVSAPARVAGVNSPTLREQGVDVDLANWRGVVAPPGIARDDRDVLGRAVERMVTSDAWRATVVKMGWTDLYQPAQEFGAFVDEERVRIQRIASRLQDERSVTERGWRMAFPLAAIAVFFGSLSTLFFSGAASSFSLLAPRRQQLATLAAALFLNLVLLETLGFIVAAAALLWLTARAFGSRRWVRDAVVGLAFSSAVYLLFTRALHLALP